MMNCPCCGALCRWLDLATQEKLKLFLAAPELLECLKEAIEDSGYGGAERWREIVAKAEGK